MTMKNTLASSQEYHRAQERIKQARDSLVELREYKLNELRQVESKLAGMNTLFGGKGKAS